MRTSHEINDDLGASGCSRCMLGDSTRYDVTGAFPFIGWTTR
jgi:hypothetical protein